MFQRISIIGFLVVSSGCSIYNPGVNPSEGLSYVIRQHDLWDGMIYFHPEDEEISSLVIRDQVDLDAFCARIPKFRIQKKYPSSPNDDPFLNGRVIDFDRHMLLISIRTSSMYSWAPIIDIVKGKESITVYRTVPQVQDTIRYAQMEGVGTYHVSVVSKSSMPIQFQTVDLP